jgi:hypothetical protein
VFKCEVGTNPPGEMTELRQACFQSIAVTRVKYPPAALLTPPENVILVGEHI